MDKNILTANFLGGIKLHYRGKMLSNFATQKVLGLFCYLLDNASQQVSRDKLISIFWGESPENQARYNLRHALWNIRKLFKEIDPDLEPLIANRNTCQIDPGFSYTLDVVEFQNLLTLKDENARPANLKKALLLYKGQFLDGLNLRGLVHWEEWLDNRRSTLHRTYLDAAVELGNYFLQIGKPELALEPFSTALTTAPDLEPAHEGLIKAYVDQGKTSSALRQYGNYAEFMKREYNAPPRTELLQLAESLRKGTYPKSEGSDEKPIIPQYTSTVKNIEAPKIPQPLSDPVPKEATQSAKYYLPTQYDFVRFVGRQQELNSLSPIIEEIQQGHGQTLIISGEMGIGKTRLFNECLRQIPDTFFIGFSASEEVKATGPISELIQAVQMISSDPRLGANLKQRLDVILSEQLKLTNTEQTSETDINILEMLRQWVISVASIGPVLIALDDLHWAGEAVLKFFATLTIDIKRLPILLVGIFRTHELQSEDAIASSLISIARTGRLWRIELGGLSMDETRQLISNRESPARIKLKEQDWKKLFRYSHGIPLFVIELSNFLNEGNIDVLESPVVDDQPDFSAEKQVVPALLQRIVKLRLSGLPDEFIYILKISALILGKFSLETAYKLFDINSDRLEDILIDLEYRNFLKHEETGLQLLFGFNHQMVKLAIRETIPILERRRLYKHIAGVYEESDAVSAEAKAYYLYNSGERDMAVPYLLASAKAWLKYGDRQKGLHYSRVAYDTALEHFGDKPDILAKVALAHAENLLKLGMVKSTIDVYNAILTRFESSDEVESGDLLARRDELKELLRTEPSHKRVEPPLLAIVSTKRALANIKALQNDTDGAVKLLNQASKVLDALPNSANTIRETGMVLQVRGKIKLRENRFSDSTVLLSNALELLKRNGTAVEVAETSRLLGLSYRSQGMNNKAGEALDQSITICQQLDDTTQLAFCLNDQGALLFEQGDYDNALKKMRKAADLASSNAELVSSLPIILTNLIKLYSAMGNKTESQKLQHELENKFADQLTDNLSHRIKAQLLSEVT